MATKRSPIHGKPSTYRHHGCRCEECRSAASAQTAASRRSARLLSAPTDAECAALAHPGEEWRTAVGYPGYEVSNWGRVRSLKWPRPRIIKPYPNRDGYLVAGLWSGNKMRRKFVHGLVCEAFIGPYPDGLEVRHLNDDKADNRLVNLRYGTKVENQADALRNGTHGQAKKTHCPKGHPYDAQNTHIRPQGWRECKSCRRERKGRGK